MGKKKKFRISLRKNHQSRARNNDLTRSFDANKTEQDDAASGERISGKGELTRKRTVIGEESAEGDSMSHAGGVLIALDETARKGRVLVAHGLTSTVEADDGTLFQCATSRLLKSLTTDQRHVVTTGDRVWFRPLAGSEGMIERIEPRHGILTRTSRKRQHVIVANVDQFLIVMSAAQPTLKPHLIDRFLISAEQGKLKAVICINKVDLVDIADLQPLVGVFSQMGYPVVLTSASTGFGLERLRRYLFGKETVVAGQSGVGKSSILNSIEPGLALRVGMVSAESEKGKHTTTTARLLRLASGGYVVDTPGIRQFALWDVAPAEVGAFFRDLRPFINHCRYPNCTHRHETDCAVKDAVADDLLDVRRYESYLHLYDGDE